LTRARSEMLGRSVVRVGPTDAILGLTLQAGRTYSVSS
jgi:hypothetical protein